MCTCITLHYSIYSYLNRKFVNLFTTGQCGKRERLLFTLSVYNVRCYRESHCGESLAPRKMIGDDANNAVAHDYK